jgi:hypothetical protein
MDAQFNLKIPGLPASLNRVGSRGSHFAFYREKRKWEGMLQIALLEQRVPRRLNFVDASAILYPPTTHRRDAGNYRMMLEKALGDVLVSGGWIEDDTPDQFRFGDCEFGEKRPKPGETHITLRISNGTA